MGHKRAPRRGPVGRQVDKHTAPPSPTVLISAIQHHACCPRQCALIHVEQTFEENVFTMRGRRKHARADSGVRTTKGAVRSLRGIPLWSDSLGIRGKADVVEIRPSGPFPVEYKAGKRRIRPTEMQLCAQALCLEEMFGTRVPQGAIYLAGTKRRETVPIDPGTSSGHDCRDCRDPRQSPGWIGPRRAQRRAVRRVLPDRRLPAFGGLGLSPIAWAAGGAVRSLPGLAESDARIPEHPLCDRAGVSVEA